MNILQYPYEIWQNLIPLFLGLIYHDNIPRGIVTIFWNYSKNVWCDWAFLWFLTCIGLQIFTYIILLYGIPHVEQRQWPITLKKTYWLWCMLELKKCLVFITIKCSTVTWNLNNIGLGLGVMVFNATFNNISFVCIISNIKYFRFSTTWIYISSQIHGKKIVLFLLMVFNNATLNTISVISRQSVLLVEETGENHWPVASHWQILSHNVVSSTPRHEQDSSSKVNSDRHWLHRCKKKNHFIILKWLWIHTYVQRILILFKDL